MRTRAFHVWDKLVSSYWFVPTLMLMGALSLAIGMLTIDLYAFSEPYTANWLYTGGAEGARTLLSAVAGSIITVAGVVFSITIATLTQASAQFGPRLLRNFMRDTGNQIVLGTFVATFLYCILVLRAIPAGAETPPPHLSVTVAVVLAVASLCLLVYFIHHVSSSIQAPQVVARAWDELRESVQRMFPEGMGCGGPLPEQDHPDPSEVEGDAFHGESRQITARRGGYLQAVDGETLMATAVDHNLRLRLPHRPGKFIVTDGTVVEAWPAHAVTDRVADTLHGAFIIGRQRTSEQDVEFTLGQMVEVAVRALSPGINDPFTAVTCVDWLAEALGEIARQDLHSPYRYDLHGELRILTTTSSFSGMVDTAFNQIRQYGRTSAPVTIRLLEAIGTIAEHVKADVQREALRRQAQIIYEQSRQALPEEQDQADVRRRFEVAIKALDNDAAPAWTSTPGSENLQAAEPA